MKYGIYKAILSIGLGDNCKRTAEWDVRNDYTEKEWQALGTQGQHEALQEWMHDELEQHISMGYEELN